MDDRNKQEKIDLILKMDDGKNRGDDGKKCFRVGPERTFLHYSFNCERFEPI